MLGDPINSSLVVSNRDLAPLTTYKTGGPARFYARPGDIADLERLAAFLNETSVSVLVIGRGSNLLVADSGFDGLVVHMAEPFSEMHFDGLEVTAGSGTPLPRLARASVEAGISGLEFFVGVPGSVGGAVRQNAGCFGVETRDRMISTRVFDLATGTDATLGPDDLEMSYRYSNLRSSQVVVSALVRGISSDVSEGTDRLKEITRWRKANQPGGTLNAGSVFKNPPGTSAGFLIDQAGLKGFAIGAVAVSEKHANFFVAGRTASSTDIRSLILEVQRKVHESTGVRLEPEIQLVGFDRDN